MLYLLNQMNAFTLNHMLLCKKETNTYAENNAKNRNCINTLIITSSTDELTIRVNKKFDLLPIIDQGGIVRLKLMLDGMLFMSEAVFQALNTWIKQFYQE